MEVGETLVDALAPFPHTDPPQRRVAELLVIGLVLAEGMVRQLEMRHQLAVQEQARADAGAERDDELEPGAAHDLQTLEVSVIDDADRTAEARLQRRREIETGPGGQQLGDYRCSGGTRVGHEVGRRQDDTFTDDAVETDRDPVEVRAAARQETTRVLTKSLGAQG